MKYSIGDRILVKINKIQETGCYCTFLPLGDNYGFMPKKLMRCLYEEKDNFTKKVGDKLSVVIVDISERGILLSDVETYNKDLEKKRKKEAAERMKQLIHNFASSYEIGSIFEAKVIKVSYSKVMINIAGTEGIILKEDTNWNEINKLSDLLFEGEIINAVYIRHEEGKLYFSLKHLNEKPYEDQLYKLSLNELLKFAGHNSNVFVGQAKRYKYGLFIENLYSIDENQKGKLLIDPIYGYNLRAILPNEEQDIQENEFYKVSLKLLHKNKRRERNQLFQFMVTEFEKTDNPYKEDVRLAFQRNTTNPSSNQRDAKLLDEIGKNMYSSKDRMFFELVQNADDAAAQKGVIINVNTIGDYLILSHNGYSFDKDDFVSITTAANGTKKANENKTGYKGIGFKSVFTDSEQVFISTGGYQFKFDKREPIFQNFDGFYLDNNPMIINEETKNRFLTLYAENKKQFDGIHSIPWQLEPIWTDSFPEELGNNFTHSNVAIALRLGENNIQGINGYQQAIDDIISNPKFMLFLRNTKRIDFNGKAVSKSTKDGIIKLKNSFGYNPIEYFKREDFSILVNNDTFEKNGIDIRIQIEESDETTGKILEAKFVDLNKQEFENIPKKIAINSSTSISFAVPIAEDGTLIPNTKLDEISMFAFLPTLVKDFKFPFYINANFILDPPRQRILGDNPWNFYLMQEIAKCLVNWCAELCKRRDINALNILVTKYFEENTPDTKQLAQYFNNAYKTALQSTPFILNHKSELSKQEEIVLDNSHLSKIIGCELFCKLINTEKYLPSESLDSTILSKAIFNQIAHFEIEDVLKAITNNADFNKWFISATDLQKEAFKEWIKDKNKVQHKENICKLIANLPLLLFKGEYKSTKEIESSNYVITTDRIQPIKDILVKLGFICSDNVVNQDFQFGDYLITQDEEDLWKSIKGCDFSNLSINERQTIFSALIDFEGVGDAKLKEIALFKNLNGDFTALKDMANVENEYPTWLNFRILAKNEYCPKLQKYLIKEESIFQDIIVLHFDLFSKVSVSELFEIFNEQWTSAFTKTLIVSRGTTEDLLNIVEQTTGAKHYFINSFGRIDLNADTSKTSKEYRVIKLAIESDYSLSTLKSNIYIDNRNLSQFTYSDEVLISVRDKEYKFSLSKLLPNQFEYGSFNHVKDVLSDISGANALFSLSRMSNLDIRNQLTKLSTPEQFAFYICYCLRTNQFQYFYWTDELFISNVLSYCFEHQIVALAYYMPYFSNQKIKGKFINADDVTTEDERLSSVIRNWADNEDKEKFLILLGARGPLTEEIKRRKSFVNNEPISLPYTSNIKDEIIAFLNWCSKLQTPYVKEHQVNLLCEMFSRINNKATHFIEDYEHAAEWSNDRYIEFVKTKLSIFLIEGEMPRRAVYNNTHLYTEYRGDFVYFKSNNTLYINVKDKNIETVLLSVCDYGINFTKEDWTKLFMVSIDQLNEKENEIAERNKTIENLSESNRHKDEIINRYREKYGDLENVDLNDIGVSESNFIEDVHKNAQEELATQSKQVIERDKVSQEDQIAAHKEAELAIREKLERDGYDCSNWLLEVENDPFNKWHSVNQIDDIISPDGEKISLVIKSAKGGYIYLSATDFEFLTSNSNNVLMVWDGHRVQSVTSKEIFNKDSNVNLIFDTEYTPKHYYAALSKVFQFIKRTTFAVKNPKYNVHDTIKAFGLDSKTEGVQQLFDDNDL